MSLVSVLLPVYNARPYLRLAIESLLAQTYNNIEIIALDDASTDGSGEELDRIQDPRVNVIHLPKSGYTTNLNFGLQVARGEFIARMDADDLCIPVRFERQLRFLKDRPDVVACGCQLRTINEQGMDGGLLPYEHDSAMVAFRLLTNTPLAHPGVMMRRRALQSVGGYRPDYEPAEDYDLWCRLSAKGRLANVTDVLLHYRVHSASVSETRREQQRTLANRVSCEHLQSMEYAQSEDEALAFRRFFESHESSNPSRDFTNYRRVILRFLRHMERSEGSVATGEIRKTIRWQLMVKSRTLPSCGGLKYRVLAFAWSLESPLAVIRRRFSIA